MTGTPNPSPDDRDEFLAHVWDLVRYWRDCEAAPSVGEKLSGLAFSILVAVDGGAAVGPYSLRAIQYDSDGADEIGLGPNIGGSLHEVFHQHPRAIPR
jgi:hypothetical protein